MVLWKEWSREKKHLVLAVILLAVYISPMFILVEDAHIRVHDNLDSNIAWYKTLKESGQLFGNIHSEVPQIINGISRNTYGTEFSGIQWLHHLFPSMLAYAISQAITRIVAFFGMYILLKTHFIKEKNGDWIRVWVSLAFALTPFWPSGMLSTLGMPLALWAFLNIRSGKHSWKEWATLVLLPFYSSFVLGFFFFLVAMGLLWLRDVIVKRKMNWIFFASIAMMTIVYLAIEYRLVYSLVIPQAPTNRNEFFESKLDLHETLLLILKNYFIGHNHVMTIHTYVIVPLSFIALWAVIGKNKLQGTLEKRYLYLFILNIVLSIWYAFWFYKGWVPLKSQISILNTFNFARFHFLRPLIIYLLFAVGGYLLWMKGKGWQMFVKVCLIAQIVILFNMNEEIRYREVGAPSFKQFYATEQFQAIDRYIGLPKSSYRVASIGLHPAIAQYNGFYTLDAYNNFYPLAYKHQFRKIIAPELEKNPVIKEYFDEWGGRCYIFVAELGKRYDFRKDSHKKIRHLQLNTKQFKKMGGKYIFSSVKIKNPASTHLTFKKAFNDKESAWKIYLYEVQ